MKKEKKEEDDHYTMLNVESGSRRVAALRPHVPFCGEGEIGGNRNPYGFCPPIRRSEIGDKRRRGRQFAPRCPLHTIRYRFLFS